MRGSAPSPRSLGTGLGRRDLLEERPPEEALDCSPPGVVGAGPPLGGRDHLGRHLWRQAQQPGAEGDLDGAPQRPLAVRHRPGDDPGHAGVPLEPRRVLVVPAGRSDARKQTADGGELDPALVERGQDVLDVPQERRVGADDQHALALEGETIGVEQVGRPVQGDGGLAGARTALDDQDARQRTPDDLVLLPLDRRHDVAHAAGTGPFEGGEQDLRSGEAEPGARFAALGIEELVLEVQHPLAFGQEMAPADQTHRVGAGGPIERLGDRRPPIDDERLLVFVRDRQPADVEGLGVRRRPHWAGRVRHPPPGRCGRRPGIPGRSPVARAG